MSRAAHLPRHPPRRRWSWEHVALVWLLALGTAVACTLVRFPPGRPLRPVRVPPPAWRAAMGPRWMVVAVRREPVLATGWLAAPLAAAGVTAAWALAGRRRPPPSAGHAPRGA